MQTGMNETTKRDTFNLEQTSKKVPSIGHAFDADMVCECGQDWESQQDIPTVCPKLIARLQTLEDLTSQLLKATDLIRKANKELERHRNELKFRRRDRVRRDVERLKGGVL